MCVCACDKIKNWQGSLKNLTRNKVKVGVKALFSSLISIFSRLPVEITSTRHPIHSSIQYNPLDGDWILIQAVHQSYQLVSN
ncbi:hypothetical protein GQ457_03G018070 [Hibiscus cannabinus]